MLIIYNFFYCVSFRSLYNRRHWHRAKERKSLKEKTIIAVPMPPQMKRKLRRRADQQYVTMSQYIRNLIAADLKETK